MLTASKVSLNTIRVVLADVTFKACISQRNNSTLLSTTSESQRPVNSLFLSYKKGQLNEFWYIWSRCLILHHAVIQFPCCVSKSNISCSTKKKKNCLVWDLRQTLLFQDICFAQISLPSFLSPCKSSAFGFCCRNPLGIATVMLLICLPFFGLHCLLTKECSFCCFGRVFSFLADVFSITQCVFFCLPAFIASSSSEDYTLGFIWCHRHY